MVGLHKIPSINGYRGAFGAHLTTGVTIVVAATKSGITTTDAAAFDILRRSHHTRHSRDAD